MQVEVAILPQDMTRLSSRVVLVIDVIRATTSLVTLFERGARSVALAADLAAAQQAGEGRSDVLLLGERAGLAPPGFAYGNSPVELEGAEVAGRDLIFTTTNGTHALRTAAGACGVLAACMRNGRAAALQAFQRARELGADIGIMCAGRGRCQLVGQDDVICAGYLVERLIEVNGGRISPWQPDSDFAAVLLPPPLEGGLDLDDSAALALRLYRGVVSDPAQPDPGEIARAFAETAVGKGLEGLGLAHDTVYCAEVDKSTLVPRLVDIGAAMPGELTMVCEVEAA